MPALIDITGQRFGRLVVLRVGKKGRKGIHRKWLCQCDCGNFKETRCSNLRSGSVTSCGCVRKKWLRIRKHGDAMRTNGKPAVEYLAWNNMRDRCENPKNVGFKYYGGRGIVVCERWSKYENFLADMGRKPSPKHSLDRIDVDQNYFKENCRWATRDEQNNNRRKFGSLAHFTDAELLIECRKRGLIHATSESSDGVRAAESCTHSLQVRTISRLRSEHGKRRRGGALPSVQSVSA